MNDDKTLPQSRQEPQELFTLSESPSLRILVESDVAGSADPKTENQTELSSVVSKDNNEDIRGLRLRLSKFLARNRYGKRNEEISISSSKTSDTRSSSISNESRVDNSSLKLPRFGNHLKRLMKLKSHREIKTQEEIITVPRNDNENSSPLVLSTVISNQIIQTHDLGGLKINENAISDLTSMTSKNSAITDITNEQSNVSPQGYTENDSAIVTENSSAILVSAALTGQYGFRTEVQIQTSRRNLHDTSRTMPLLYPWIEEPRVENYIQNMLLGSERNSIATTGSESSNTSNGVSEVVDANEQPEGRDVAERYYNALLRAVIRKQFRHLDNEPPIY